ncbi:helix-turn-helix domain-containing protein [Rhodococcus parequi]|uniref:helix-turn-helix domain-containing protein n=1 Tax=Rhodococcus parequi TaxID=3137122 RepID=UPI003B3AE9A8
MRLRPMWLTEAEALRVVGRAPSTLRRWRYQGEVKAQKLFGQWRYERESLEACELEQVRRYMERPFPGRGRKQDDS